MTELLDVLNTSAALQLLLIIVLLLHKGRKKLSNRFLILFFFAQLIIYTQVIMHKHYEELYANYIYYSLIGLPFSFLWGPCIYLYIISDHHHEFSFKQVHFLHFAPALIAFVYIFAIIPWIKANPTLSILSSFNDWKEGAYLTILGLQLIIYNAMAVLKLERNSKSWNYGNIDKSRIKWNKFILYGYIIACLLYNIPLAAEKFNNPLLSPIFLSNFIFSVYFYIIIYKALTSPHLFSFNKENDDSFELKENILKLENYLIREKPYLNFDLTVKELAQKLNLSAPSLSKLINQHKKQSFYDYINTHRIEEAKNLLRKSEKEKTIQEIMYECGYSSKSSFNTAFKRMTGKTPTDYRKAYQKPPLS